MQCLKDEKVFEYCIPLYVNETEPFERFKIF